MTEKIKREHREYYVNGMISLEKYSLNSKIHRDNGPAFIKYYENGNTAYKSYYFNGKIHRDNGPAFIKYYKNGNIEYKQYYLHDIEITNIYYEIKEILEKLSIQYPNEDDLGLVFKLSYNDFYYQVFELIQKESIS